MRIWHCFVLTLAPFLGLISQWVCQILWHRSSFTFLWNSSHHTLYRIGRDSKRAEFSLEKCFIFVFAAYGQTFPTFHVHKFPAWVCLACVKTLRDTLQQKTWKILKSWLGQKRENISIYQADLQSGVGVWPLQIHPQGARPPILSSLQYF